VEYTPFRSVIGSVYVDSSSQVEGVGTVILRTKRSPGISGKNSHGTILLENVLHIPSFTCNILASTESLMEQFVERPDFSGQTKGGFWDRLGRPVAYFAREYLLFEVELIEPPIGPIVGPRVLDKEKHYLLNAT
jgi:hypothetical protein